MKKIKKKITAKQKEAWFEAVRNNDIETVQRMLEDGVDVNCQDTARWSALHLASYWGNIDIANLLINNGADVNAKDDTERIPLHLACDWGYIEMAKLLINNGADVNIQEINGWTALHSSCYNNHLETAKLLIDNGATITAKSNDGDTPLDYLKRTYPQKYEELMEWITEYHPEMMLELMASENIQSKGVEL